MTASEKITQSDRIQYIIGTCTDVDKPYLRLHLYSDSQPDPATIRPESVLRESLRSVIRRERESEAYDIIRDQYMSICQDMKLQGIISAFAVQVRECMAVAALRARVSREEGIRIDMHTFSDCLLHLSSLYHQNPDQPRELEFAVYRFLFWSALAYSRPEEAQHVNSALKVISSYRDKACVRHALRIQSAVSTGDYYTYFKELGQVPAETAEQRHIHETLILPIVRDRAYQAVLKAYKFRLPLAALRRALGFEEPAGLSAFLAARGGAVVGGGTSDGEEALDVDASRAAVAAPAAAAPPPAAPASAGSAPAGRPASSSAPADGSRAAPRRPGA